MSVGFLITFPLQVYHYKWIAPHLPGHTALLEARGRDHGLTEAFVAEHLPGSALEWVAHHRLPGLDGRFEAMVCQMPVRRLALMERTLVIAQQYSLAKERYQYGLWRSHVHLNLMYGPYSVEKVSGFSHAVAVGNPLLDPYHRHPSPAGASIASGRHRPRLLYLPTWSELSSLHTVLPRLRYVDADITLKLHHAETRAKATVKSVARHRQLRVVYSDTDPVSLLREHDGVISDVSGAAYDALYAGMPVVLTPPAATSLSNRDLSPAERDHSALAEVTATWHEGEDLFAAFATAAARLKSPAYEAFLAARFVNPGTAGAAAAREIHRLLADGDPYHFGVRQLRGATRRGLIDGTRPQLRGRSGTCAGGEPVRPGAHRIDLRLAYWRIRWQLARIGLLRRAVRHLLPLWRAIRAWP